MHFVQLLTVKTCICGLTDEFTMQNKFIVPIVWAAVLLLSHSCTSSHQNDADVMKIEVDVKQEVSYDYFFEKEYKAITLATPDNAIVGKISKIQFADSILYALDKGQNAIFAFSIRGHFLHKYCHVGQGRGEYSYLSDFEVYNEKMYILSRVNKCIYQYTLDDKYIDEIELPDWFEAFRIINDEEIWLYSDYSNSLSYNIIRYNYQEGKILAEYFPFMQNETFSLAHNVFHEGSKGQLLYTQLYDHSVYELKEGGTQTLCTLSFNTPEQITGNTEETSLYELHRSQSKKSVVRFLGNVTLKDSILYATYINEFRTRIVRVNLNSGVAQGTRIRIVDEYPFTFGLLTFWQGKAVSVLDAATVLDVAEVPFPSNKNSDGLLHEDDNPVIFIRELK